MQKISFVIAFLVALAAPALAQKAQIEAVNAKWVELFNKGDFGGIAELYTADAIAFPPGSPMVRGKAAIGAMWKGLAEQAGNPKHMSASDPKRTLRRRSSSRYDDLSLGLEATNEAARIFHACWWCGGGVAAKCARATAGQSAYHRLSWCHHSLGWKSMGCRFCSETERTRLDRRSNGSD
jgi:SnoaL-like protein